LFSLEVFFVFVLILEVKTLFLSSKVIKKFLGTSSIVTSFGGIKELLCWVYRIYVWFI